MDETNKTLINLKQKSRTVSTLTIVLLSYIVFILIGTFLLMSPIASNAHERTGFIDSLFTATSATCVTGLVVYDTFQHWSLFGQLVILFMIQMGGIGFMSVIAFLSRSLRVKMSFKDRKFLMESVGIKKKGDFVSVLRNIVVGSIISEVVGAALLCIRFVPQFGASRGIYFAAFHSISAFCNAGFDLMGALGVPFASFTSYAGDWLVNLVLIALIFLGGLGFIVWDDLIRNKFRAKDLSLHSRLMLVASGIILFVSTLLFVLFEFNHLYKGMNGGEAFLRSLFEATTSRTAGFNTTDMESWSDGSIFLTIILMFIGAGSGSTAGGIKVTTMVIILLGIIALNTKDGHIVVSGKKIGKEILHQAFAIISTYLILVCIFTGFILGVDPEIPLKNAIFEVVSAIGTVGMAIGDTTLMLNPASRLGIIILMYIGRVGILTIVLSFAKPQRTTNVIIPAENVMVG